VSTFNVWGLPSWLTGASAERYHTIATELSGLGSDVVLLQEVWTHRSFAELSSESKKSERTWWTASARLKGTFLGQNGLLTLSKYPIVGAEVKHFATARLPDSLMHKGALKVTIAIGPGQRLNIWNVHLQDGASRRVRSRQIAELIDWIDNSHDAQIADIVGGDFNFTPESREFSRFAAAIGPDVHQLAGDTTFPTWDGLKHGRDGGQTLDHIFVRLRRGKDEIGAQSRRIFAASRQQDRLSDHMGLEASITIGRTAQALAPVLAGQKTENTVVETAALLNR
jgi:endonuclease/exonuclease/phosphatase family metal-dependent hydrolase